MWTVLIILIAALILVIIGDYTKYKGLIPLGTCIGFGIAIIFVVLYHSIDYRIHLQQSNSIRISDKHNNTQIIELDSLEEFIIRDNI